MPTSPSNIYRIAAQFRQAQLNNERAAAVEMVRQYGQIWQNIDYQIRNLTREYYTELQAGRISPSGWLARFERLQSLRSQVEREMMRFAGQVEASIRMQQWQAIQAGGLHAHELMQAASGMSMQFNTLPTSALVNMVGFTQDGSPLMDLLLEYGKGAARMVADGLVQGLALGQGPAVIARNIRAQMGGQLARALLLARTETLRAYRTASMENYRANGDIVEGWVWLSARNTRTCAMCWAMDGTFHTLDETLDDHPNGRCTAAPKIKGMDLPMRETGVQAFEKLSDADKLRVLGPSKYGAYRAGDLKLKQLVGTRHSDQWGRMFHERSLSQVLGSRTAKSWMERAKEDGLWGLSPSLGAARNRLAELQLQRFNQLNGADAREVMARMRSWNLPLPELGNHFRTHADEFLSSGITSVEQYQAAFAAHIEKTNLRYFTYLQRKRQDRIWISVDEETGNVGQFNETKNTYWSFYHHDEIDKYLNSGKMWWIEVIEDGNEIEFLRWT